MSSEPIPLRVQRPQGTPAARSRSRRHHHAAVTAADANSSPLPPSATDPSATASHSSLEASDISFAHAQAGDDSANAANPAADRMSPPGRLPQVNVAPVAAPGGFVQIRLISQHTFLADSVAAVLREQGHEVEVRPDTVYECELKYRPSTPLAEVSALVEGIKPLLPSVHADEAVADAEVELRLGEAKPLAAWEVKLLVDSEQLAERMRTRLGAMGFRDDGTVIEDQERSYIKYGGATGFARQVVRWLVAQEGVRVTESKEWGDDDDDIWIYARDPSLEGKAPKERFPVEVHGDDYERMFILKERLEAAGFAMVQVRSLDEGRRRFLVDPGPLARDAGIASDLQVLVTQFLTEMDVDTERFPLELAGAERGHARIDLPLGAMASGALRPYTGAWPERWDVVLRTDDVAGVQGLVDQLADNGYTSVRLETLPASALGFTVTWGAAAHESDVADLLRGLLESLIAEGELEEGYELTVSDSLDDEDARILVDLPLRAARRTPMAARIGDVARNFELSLKTPSPDDVGPVAEMLKALPWKAWALEAESDVDPEIQYGGAPVQLVEHVQRLVEQATGIRLPLSKDWGDADDDIWVHLPRPDVATSDDDDAPLDLAEWLSAGGVGSEPIPLVAITADHVRIGPVTLQRRHGGGDVQLVPRPELFAHYCLDTRTVETLIHLAESVLLREPCLLEGETSVSKTSIVLYLAMLLEQPVVRLNLNGQTDTGELVGRYVPQDVAAALPVDPEELFAASDLLESESRMILQRSADEGRTLNRVEVQQIMANERMTVHPWRWQDGLVVTAMKRGWWVILDELNLAEPQILERLNPVLEPFPSIVLTEHDNSVIGMGGDPVHPSFRVFATMNPAEYAGRSALSPAYRDRWRAYRYVVPPTEAEYHAMLRFLVYGVHPDVAVAGERYTGQTVEAPMGALAEVEGIDDFMRAVARFHAALEEAVGRRGGARAGQLGARRRDRYVFSRRGLLAVIEYLASNLGSESSVRTMRRALARYYVGRVQPGGDQRVVARLLDAAGIGPGTWAPDRLDALVAAAGHDDDDDDSDDSDETVVSGEADELLASDLDTDDLSTLIGEE
jgi:MoxR-like ATPase